LSGLGELATAIDAGRVKTVVAIGEDLAAAGLTAAQLVKVSVIYLGTHVNPTSTLAKVVFPGLTVFEKNGTFVNQQFRLQKFAKAVPGVTGAVDDLTVLAKLIVAAGGALVAVEINALWSVLAAEVPALGPISFKTLPDTGLLLDSTPWAGWAFVEGETLHYQPKAVASNG